MKNFVPEILRLNDNYSFAARVILHLKKTSLNSKQSSCQDKRQIVFSRCKMSFFQCNILLGIDILIKDCRKQWYSNM